MGDTSEAVLQDLFAQGEAAAWSIWKKSAAAREIVDPRLERYAAGVMAGFAAAADSTGEILRQVITNAGASAEGLNIDVFQGIVEVLQNADDLGAETVRFALTGKPGGQKLLIVHDGMPVTCHHVLPMVLPFLTTKADDAKQKGRFGIGLKTLGRVARAIAIHSDPYHFAAEGLNIATLAPAAAITDFYEPGVDTLLRLDLVADFSRDNLEAWFAAWEEDGLLFLRSIRRFAWRDLESGQDRAKVVAPEDWRQLQPLGKMVVALATRRVVGTAGAWTVYRATVPTTPAIPRAHKATGKTTSISFALADHDHPAGLFVGFRTRLPVTLPFSIDAQFDPSTAREGLIDNAWNRWLISQCAEGLEEIGILILETKPKEAWPWIAIPGETAGPVGDRWPCGAFDESLAKVRSQLSAKAIMTINRRRVAMDAVAFEDKALEGLLSSQDVEALRPGRTALSASLRDAQGRWRSVLIALEGPLSLGTAALAEGFVDKAFEHKAVDWWVQAGARLTRHHPPAAIAGLPCWRSDQDQAIACAPKASTARPLVLAEPLSAFARRWGLMERLHDAYQASEVGEAVLKWLYVHAEVTGLVDAAVDLKAFAETFANAPQNVNDEDLRAIRDRFDLLTDRAAAPLGPSVGAALRLDAFNFKAGQRQELKVSPRDAYLSKTLEGEYANWPIAAGSLPGIRWLASSYDERLKTGATRAVRKRADGTISRGPRKFLLLLGAAITPRVTRIDRVLGGAGLRKAELAAARADHVDHDFISPDLDRVIASLERATKKDRKIRGPALLKTLSRHWETYGNQTTAPAKRTARVYIHDAGFVTAGWLTKLKETAWIVVGAGELCTASNAVVRSPATLTLYAAKHFIFGAGPEDIKPAFASALKLITDVRASDLVNLLERYRQSGDPDDAAKTVGVYRSLAKLRTGQTAWNAKIGDMELPDLRNRFRLGRLIWTPTQNGGGQWRAPSELFIGRDIFHDSSRFVPGGPSCADLWSALAISRPSLDDCLTTLRGLTAVPYSASAEAILIEVYRYIEPLMERAERRQKDRLRVLPVGSNEGWAFGRPIYQLHDRELRAQLSSAHPTLRFWNPPCDTQSLPMVTAALGLTNLKPMLKVGYDAMAKERGEALADRFEACVNHLSNELARNDPATRDKMQITWDALRRIPLRIHEVPFDVSVRDPELGSQSYLVQMGAVLQREPLCLDVCLDALPLRDSGGRAVASLFAMDVRHRIEAEWVASWVASGARPVERINVASDADHQRALADRAASVKVNASAKIKVTAPASRTATTVAPRRLKHEHSGVASVHVQVGHTPSPAVPGTTRPLVTFVPPPSPTPTPSMLSEPMEYSNADLEQRGWEILIGLLNTSTNGPIVDFRRRHGVGADGAINWRTFVELKATARAPQTSVDLSAAEFERARSEGLNFMLALVSGLEEGRETQVRMILNPTNRATVKPLSTVRLTGLLEADAIIVTWSDEISVPSWLEESLV